MVNITDVMERLTRDLLAANQKLNGVLVQAPFFNTSQTVRNDTITLFELDAIGGTIREVLIIFFLAADAAATFTLTWETTRAGDLVTFTSQAIPAIATIATPAAARVYSYTLGEIAEGLQGRFRVAQDNLGNANNVIDGVLVALMEV